jgi:predicted kinase
MAKCYQLIGVPGSGKSTWVAHQEWADKCAYISTDKWVDDYARDMGKTYNEVFKEYMPEAIDMMINDVVKARVMNKDIIWDQTSTTVKSRKKKFNMLPDYEHIAVVFRTPESEELSKRLASRPGKNIPEYVIRTMIDGWEEPTLAEGYSEIMYA